MTAPEPSALEPDTAPDAGAEEPRGRVVLDARDIARALTRECKLLLLDEPYEGLAPVIVQEIEKILVEIREAGITTVIVEQNAVAALKLSDRAVILDTGQVAFTGTAKEVLENEALRHEYLAI